MPTYTQMRATHPEAPPTVLKRQPHRPWEPWELTAAAVALTDMTPPIGDSTAKAILAQLAAEHSCPVDALADAYAIVEDR